MILFNITRSVNMFFPVGDNTLINTRSYHKDWYSNLVLKKPKSK